MKFKGENILSAGQFDRAGLISLFKEASNMEKIVKKGQSDILKGKVMATLFFEPSTRTRFSFETAMLRLGGRVISNADMVQTSSFTKLETLEDTGKVVSQMADVIVMRHPVAGSVSTLAKFSDVPVINAGDGSAEHPTQALLDLYTIWKNFGRIDGLTVGMIGDLKNSRVQHSQCEMLKHFKVKFVLCSPKGLEMSKEIVEELHRKKLDVQAVNDLKKFVGMVDVLSVSRIQKERFVSEREYKKFAGTFVINAQLMKFAKKSAIVIHPLPRVDEISVDVDDDPRAKYFEQVKNGVFVRMALLKKIFKG
ncbi:aspartate carbamoyltransferase [Candidatus Peregrinibacteria bacterium RIFCSPLOWO2_01_FULL_39_12]|nr:MAG: aspartate carbamoyltransferase [Candidatus Peregrinibacteria bacterium RIFCSPLOWO2_01_FULL_39_12]